jgi:hypothetical protein
MEEAAKWFEAQLRRPKEVGARAYLDKRGVPEKVRLKFRLGYLLRGSSRSEWEHSLADALAPRFSITFRTLRAGVSQGDAGRRPIGADPGAEEAAPGGG